MTFDRIDPKSWNVIDSISVARDAGGKPGVPLFLVPLEIVSDEIGLDRSDPKPS
jgi:hypothetical protein